MAPRRPSGHTNPKLSSLGCDFLPKLCLRNKVVKIIVSFSAAWLDCGMHRNYGIMTCIFVCHVH